MQAKPPVLSEFAFLSVLEPEDAGFVGGLLVLNRTARPLEFHCTTPVRASRAQQILYGPTLRPYLFAEQIGGALLGRMKAKPGVLFTDRPEMLELRTMVTVPVALVLPHDAAGSDAMSEFTAGRNRLAVAPERREDMERIIEQVRDVAAWYDMVEPFQRIADAVNEARRAA